MNYPNANDRMNRIIRKQNRQIRKVEKKLDALNAKLLAKGRVKN